MEKDTKDHEQQNRAPKSMPPPHQGISTDEKDQQQQPEQEKKMATNPSDNSLPACYACVEASFLCCGYCALGACCSNKHQATGRTMNWTNSIKKHNFKEYQITIG